MILEYTKMKVLNLTNSLRTNPEEAIRIGLNLIDVANVVKNIENPKRNDEKTCNMKKVTLFPKDARGITNWNNLGKATNIDKAKALHLIEALQNHSGTLTSEELSSAANIVRNFVNPKQDDGNLHHSEKATAFKYALDKDYETNEERTNGHNNYKADMDRNKIT